MPKIPFETIKKQIIFGNLIWNDRNLRTLTTESLYDANKKILEKQGLTLERFILEKYFTKHKRDFYLCRSDFPYDNIEIKDHFILWILNDGKKAIETAKNYFFDKEYIYFQNLPTKQSIRGIKHYHFLVKENNQ